MTVKGAATLTANILVGRPHYVQLLIVGVDESGPSVYSIDSAGGSIPDLYCATGSGSPFMYGVLEDQFSKGMKKEEAISLAAKGAISIRTTRQCEWKWNGFGRNYMKDGYVQLTEEEISKVLSSL